MLSILAVHQAAEDLLACVCQALAQIPAEIQGLAGCPCRSCVVPGAQVAWDGCDGACPPVPGEYSGQLSVNVVRLYSSDIHQFPRDVQAVRDVKNCPMPQTTAVELAVTVLRCVPGPRNDGCPPTCEQMSDAAMQLHVDMLKVQQGALCCYAATDTSRRGGRRYVLGQSRTVGPQGDCAGFEQRITVALDDCLPCPPQDAV